MTEFFYDDETHAYTLPDGRRLPHITGMLKTCGLIDDRWYTEESSERGVAVHKLTADYDLGALAVSDCVSVHRGYLLGHVQAMSILRPEILDVEIPRVHPAFLFGGRLDRVLRAYQLLTVYEIKSGGPEPSHPIQTALQAILASAEYGLPPESWARLCCYLTTRGKFRIVTHDNRRDFDEARRIIRRCCS